jgi:hypothetical protein
MSHMLLIFSMKLVKLRMFDLRQNLNEHLFTDGGSNHLSYSVKKKGFDL